MSPLINGAKCSSKKDKNNGDFQQLFNDNDNLIDKETKVYLNLISNLNSKQINSDFNAFKNLYQNIGIMSQEYKTAHINYHRYHFYYLLHHLLKLIHIY